MKFLKKSVVILTSATMLLSSFPVQTYAVNDSIDMGSYTQTIPTSNRYYHKTEYTSKVTDYRFITAEESSYETSVKNIVAGLLNRFVGRDAGLIYTIAANIYALQSPGMVTVVRHYENKYRVDRLTGKKNLVDRYVHLKVTFKPNKGASKTTTHRLRVK